MTDALTIAQQYTEAIEAKDFAAVSGLLAQDVEMLFPISAGPVGGPQAHFVGKEEVLGYIESLLSKFSSLRWVAPEWTQSADRTRVFMEARGDMVVAHSDQPYRNVYITRIDVHDGLIVFVAEYANSDLYMAQEIPPRPAEIRAAERAASEAG